MQTSSMRPWTSETCQAHERRRKEEVLTPSAFRRRTVFKTGSGPARFSFQKWNTAEDGGHDPQTLTSPHCFRNRSRPKASSSSKVDPSLGRHGPLPCKRVP